jgi:hypothetical protein
MILIPVSAHIKKYADSRFGSPIVLDDRNSFLIILKLTLVTWQSTFNFPQEKQKILPNDIIIDCIYYYKKLPQEKITILVWLFETLFIEDLIQYIQLHAHKKSRNTSRPNTIRCIEQFCLQHNIEIDRDVMLDTIIKKYYRHKAKLHNKLPPTICPFTHISEKPNLLNVVA